MNGTAVARAPRHKLTATPASKQKVKHARTHLLSFAWAEKGVTLFMLAILQQAPAQRATFTFSLRYLSFYVSPFQWSWVYVCIFFHWFQRHGCSFCILLLFYQSLVLSSFVRPKKNKRKLYTVACNGKVSAMGWIQSFQKKERYLDPCVVGGFELWEAWLGWGFVLETAMIFVSIGSSNINKLIIFMGFLWIREFGLISHVSKL